MSSRGLTKSNYFQESEDIMATSGFWFETYYPLVGFVQATGLPITIALCAYKDFRQFTLTLQRTEGNNYYGYDGIITESFERWMKQQNFTKD
jgi:hypothetical protein